MTDETRIGTCDICRREDQPTRRHEPRNGPPLWTCENQTECSRAYALMMRAKYPARP